MGARNFSAAALALTVAAAMATAACGGSDGGGTGSVSARAAGGLPSDLNVAFVEAGPGMGWVAGSHGGDPTVQLWAVAPGGSATAVAALPDLVSMAGAAIGPDVAVAGLRCHDGSAAARSCGSTTGEVN